MLDQRNLEVACRLSPMLALFRKQRRTFHKVNYRFVHSAIAIHATGPAVNARQNDFGIRLCLCVADNVGYIGIHERELAFMEHRNHVLEVLVEFGSRGGITETFFKFGKRCYSFSKSSQMRFSQCSESSAG